MIWREDFKSWEGGELRDPTKMESSSFLGCPTRRPTQRPHPHAASSAWAFLVREDAARVGSFESSRGILAAKRKQEEEKQEEQEKDASRCSVFSPRCSSRPYV